jgi:hypothetical protein
MIEKEKGLKSPDLPSLNIRIIHRFFRKKQFLSGIPGVGIALKIA